MTPGGIGRLGAWALVSGKTLLGIGGAGVTATTTTAAGATAATATAAEAVTAASESVVAASQVTGIAARTAQAAKSVSSAVKEGATYAKANPVDAAVKTVSVVGKAVTNAVVPITSASVVVGVASHAVSGDDSDSPEEINSDVVKGGMAAAATGVGLKVAKEVVGKRVKPIVWVAEKVGNKFPAVKNAVGNFADYKLVRSGIDGLKYIGNSAWTGATTVAAAMGISMTQGEAISGAYTSAAHEANPIPAVQVAEAVRDKYTEIKDAGMQSTSGTVQAATILATGLVENLVPPVAAISAREMAIIADPRTNLDDPHTRKLVDRHLLSSTMDFEDPVTIAAARRVMDSGKLDMADGKVKILSDNLRGVDLALLAAPGADLKNPEMRSLLEKRILSDDQKFDIPAYNAAQKLLFNPTADLSDPRVQNLVARVRGVEFSEIRDAADNGRISNEELGARVAAFDGRWDGIMTKIVVMNTESDNRLSATSRDQPVQAVAAKPASPSHSFNPQASAPADIVKTGGLVPKPEETLPPLVAPPAEHVDTSGLRAGLGEGAAPAPPARSRPENSQKLG